MAVSERSTVVGIFADRSAAEAAVDELRRAQFAGSDIVCAEQGAEEMEGLMRTGEPQAGEKRAARGAIAGAVLGALAGAVGLAVVPAMAPALAGGVVLLVLGGAAVGAAVGGLIGAVADFAAPPQALSWQENKSQPGRTRVRVEAGGRDDEAAEILRRHGAHYIDRR